MAETEAKQSASPMDNKSREAFDHLFAKYIDNKLILFI